MNVETIQKAQAYLTINREDQKRKIIDVEILLKRHSQDSVVSLLENLLKEKQKNLVNLIQMDQSKYEIDETIAEMFRITMAIKIIQREGEEVKIPCSN
jgi:hypothetical protein